MEIEKLLAKSHVTLETRKILQARASMLFPTLPKRSKRKQKTEDNNEDNSSSKNDSE